MKEEQKIYIKGSKDRPDDVKKVLEQYGGRVKGIINFTLNGIYFINHKGIIDYTPEGSELSQMITEYYHEVKLPSLEEMHNSKGNTIRVLSNGKTMLKLD